MFLHVSPGPRPGAGCWGGLAGVVSRPIPRGEVGESGRGVSRSRLRGGYPSIPLVTTRKRSLRRLCFYRCLSFILFTGRGACVVLFGGACVVLCGGHAPFYSGGACMVLFGGRAWFYSGGVHGFIRGGVRGFIRGAWFYLGGVHGFIRGGHAWFYSGGRAWFYSGGHAWFFQFFGYNEIRSMSGRYASYWNAFLLMIFLILKFILLVHRLHIFLALGGPL